MSEEEDENVVQLFGSADEPDVRTKGLSYRACKHRQIDLHVEDRRAFCRSCKEEVSVFDWLYNHIGGPWETLWHRYQSMKTDLKTLARSREQLKREVKNLKAQARRWREKAADARREASLADQLTASISAAKEKEDGRADA
jgi:hypothetical protein